MTHRFHVSRLAEIAEAAPVEPVSFPGRNQIVALRRTLRRWRGAPARRAAAEPAPTASPVDRTD
ncbi:MAG TPA: hypothetical protein VIN58_22560 [Roseateles sp.]